MTEKSLLERVKRVNTDAKSAGKRYVILWAECVEHMFGDSHDWTVLATLVSGAGVRDAAILRALTGKALKGWSLVKDKDQPTGLRFKKIVGEEQGFDNHFVSTIKVMGQQGKALQSADILAMVKPNKDKKTRDAAAVAKSVAKALRDNGLTMADIMDLVRAELSA
jgi:predicted Zn-ribbon and HTH transcriptional regulator